MTAGETGAGVTLVAGGGAGASKPKLLKFNIIMQTEGSPEIGGTTAAQSRVEHDETRRPNQETTTVTTTLPTAPRRLPTDAPCPRDWSDEQLLARLLDRDEAAWREFHRRFDRLVYRCIHNVTRRFRSTVAPEDVQEIRANLLVDLTARDMKKLRCYDRSRGQRLSSWIGMLATNAAWDYLRSLSRRPPNTGLLEATDLGDSNPDPADCLLEREKWRLVNQTLARFSPSDRRFVRLFYVDGLSPDEIAETLRISVKTVYTRKHKIRCRLEDALRSERVAYQAAA